MDPHHNNTQYSGGSRISRWGGGGGAEPFGGGANLQRGYFSAKMYAKMKELDPVGGGTRRRRPPRSANAIVLSKIKLELNLK